MLLFWIRGYIHNYLLLIYCFQDSGDLFNFIPVGADEAGPYRRNEERSKRSASEALSTNYTFIKKPTQGYKIIRVEIYDAKMFECTDETICKCKAELCAQHVVKSILFDDIYITTRDLISKIQKLIDQ